MTSSIRILCTFMAALLTAHISSWAAPGEDPVAITGRVNYLQLPLAPVTRSTSVQYLQQMPDDAAAKISRYTAKAYSNNLGEIKTEKDVVHSVQTKGMQTNCYQSIGSVVAPKGMGNNEQVVVLRGDVINICN